MNLLQCFSPILRKSCSPLHLLCFDIRDFLLSCRGVGVRPPLELSHTLVNFGATAIGDHSTAVIILTNHQSSRFRPKPPDAAGVKDGQSPPRLFSFLLPNNSDITLTPATGRLLPGEVSGRIITVYVKELLLQFHR